MLTSKGSSDFSGQEESKQQQQQQKITALVKCKTAQSTGESTGPGTAGGWPLEVQVDAPGERCLENHFPMPQNPMKF